MTAQYKKKKKKFTHITEFIKLTLHLQKESRIFDHNHLVILLHTDQEYPHFLLCHPDKTVMISKLFDDYY